MSDTAVTNHANVQMKSSSTKRNRQLLFFGVFITVVLIGTIFALAYQRTVAVRENTEEEVQQMQKNLISSRVFAIDNWLKEIQSKGRLLAESEFFQLFASEVDKLGDVPALFAQPDNKAPAMDDLDGGGAKPSSRLPLMRIQLTEFVAYANFATAHIVNSKGDPYLSTAPSLPLLNPEQKERIKQVVETQTVGFGSIYRKPDGLAVDVYMPILAPMFERQARQPVGVLILTQQVDVKLGELMAVSPTDVQSDLHLVQSQDGKFEEVIKNTFEFKPLPDLAAVVEGGFPFDVRDNLTGSGKVYSSGQKIQALDCWLVAQNDAAGVRDRFISFAKTTYSLAGLFALVLVLFISGGWWWLVGREQASINEQFRDLLVVIEDQRKLLDGINNTISDPIALTDGKGIYQYVNKAFAQVVGREENEVIGLDGPAVFGFDTARRLNATDQHVLMTGESTTVSDVLYLRSQRYHFQISKAPLRDSQTRTPQGIVSVYRDITQLVETQERGRRVVQQTIDALVRTIEQADPFLGGHSRIMGGVASLVAKQLHLAEFDVSTIEAAANLSQIGKMFVPREILLKPGLLTPEEKAEMEKHVEHARNVLKDIEFDLPVVDGIAQMNELLNGTGYPLGLSGDDISMHARVLAVANVFAAMARPRAYRGAVPVAEVLRMLEAQTDKYDQTVVAALRQVLDTPAGERLVQQAAAGKAV